MPWRIIDLECDIYTLHAAEDYFLERVGLGDTPTVLFSRLTRPAISIGKMQNLRKDVDLEEATRLGVDVTRRETGGRSIYLDSNHYIISLIDRHSLGSLDLHLAYQERCGHIIRVLSQVSGVDFTLQYVNDIMTLDERKVGGAAQRHIPSASLVHCYLRLATDFDIMLRLIKIDDVKLNGYRAEFERFASSLKNETGVDAERFCDQFREAFLLYLGDVSISPLTLSERERIEEIVHKLYKNMEYVHGKGDEPSRGNCDLIAGSGENAVLKIPALVGKVTFK